MLLGACATAPTVKIHTPTLENPPPGAVSALEAQGKKDPDTAHWVVQLFKHYLSLDEAKK